LKPGSERYHLVGVGGAGMSAIATILAARGREVTGSDLRRTPVLERLQRQGIKVWPEHSESNVVGADIVVISSAVPDHNVEVVAAREHGLPIVHRGRVLAQLMNGSRGIAVAGSHGKTTTTAMIALVLLEGGLDPTVLVGGDVAEFGGNARVGTGDYLVAEADESDGSFLWLRPEIGVVTNIEDDHLDHYGSYDHIVQAFEQFMDNIDRRGVLVACADDPQVRQLIARRPGQPMVTYGREEGARVRAVDVRLNAAGAQFTVEREGRRLGTIRLLAGGAHNVANALAAVAVGLHAGVPFAVVSSALGRFRGVARRFQTIGEVAGVRVVDDYAHHPTEVQAVLQLARQVSEGRVLCVFQPHRFTRTGRLADGFGMAFAEADQVYLLDIYPAGEPALPGVSSALVADAISRHTDRRAVMVRDFAAVVERLRAEVRPGDLVLTVGAGNVWMVAEQLVAALEAAGPGEADRPTTPETAARRSGEVWR